MMRADRVSLGGLTRPLTQLHVHGAEPVKSPILASGRIPALFACLSAGIFATASGVLNVTYGWNKGTDMASSTTWAAVAAAVAIIFSLSWPALIRSLEARRWSAAAMTLAALLLSGAYSVTAALGSAAGGRADTAMLETATADARKRAQAAYDSSQSELAKISAARPVGEVEALLAAAKPQCRVVVAHGFRDTVCSPPANLSAELARAKRRAELEATSATAAGQLAITGPAKQANSDAKAVSSYLSAIGLDVDADRVSRLLVLLSVLIVECGAGLSLTVGLSLSATQASVPQAASGQDTQLRTSQTTAADAAQDAPNAAGRTLPDTRTASVQTSGLEDWLRGQGGKAHVGMRRLGAALGCSPSAAHDAVRRAAAAGVVRATPGPRGTALELVVRLN
jgi:hypothetical protein